MSAPNPPVPAPAARNLFIDHLRVLLTALVILHHTAIAYGGSGGWYWREEPNGSKPLLVLFNATNQSYFMGFFFLLAGYYSPGPYDRKGAGRFLADRFLRLGLPLLGYFFFLSPMTIALARTSSGHSFFPDWWLMIREREFEPGPLWFAEALLILALLYAAWRKWISSTQPSWSALPSHRVLLLAAVLAGIASFLARLAVPVGKNVCWLQLGYFVPYIVLFVAGCCAAREKILERIELRQARPWMIVSVVAFFALPAVLMNVPDLKSFTGGWSPVALFYALWDPFMGWGVTLGLLWSFRTWFSGGNAFTDGLARRAYGAYIVHPPVVVGLCLLARGWTTSPFLKFGVIGLAACAGAWVVASFLVLIPGLRKIL